MLDVIAKLGIGAGAGFLLGLIAVWWVEPTTSEGTGLLIAVFIAIATIVGGAVSFFIRPKNDDATKDES